MHNKRAISILLIVVAILAAGVGLFTGIPQSTSAAPVTPVTGYASGAGGEQSVTAIDWMTRRRITADTTVCKDVAQYKLATIQWVIDQGTVNTTTIKFRETNDGVNYWDQATLANANVADGAGNNQFVLTALKECMLVDVANGNAITITIVGKGMQ